MADETTAPPADGKPTPPRVDARKLCEYHRALLAQRAPWETLWQEIATYVVPRRVPGMGGTVMTPSTAPENRLFDTTAVQAHQTNAAGCVAWMTPADSAWFNFTPPRTIKEDGARRWLAECGQTARERLGVSNFYTAIHECFLDAAAFGTMALYAEPDDEEGVFFQCWPVGTFCISEDHKGRVETVIREFELTAEQAGEKFGEQNLSADIQKKIKNGGEAALEKFKFLHFVMPRPETKREGTAQQQMPVACYYIEKDKNLLVKESGYQRMPVFVSRYLEWGTGTGGCYGWAPAFSALPEARQVNFLQKFMDALAEKLAFPPWLAPEEMEGEIDPNAAGVTYFAKGLQAHELPREMPPAGRYDVGKDRVIERQTAINKAFHVDLFQMFASMDKPGQMTAREVAERTAEKLVQFSPTFARRSSEVLTPLLRWLFLELLVQGDFGRVEDWPQELLSPDGTGIALPVIQFSSRIAIAMQQLPTIGAFRTLEMAAEIVKMSGSPAVLDNLEVDKILREAAITNGMSAENLVPEYVVADLRKARAQAQQQAEQMAAMEQMASAAGKVGGIKKDAAILNMGGQQQAA